MKAKVMRRSVLQRIVALFGCAALSLSPAFSQIKPGGGAPVTPAGVSATQAGAIQGVTGGVPVPVTGTFTASLGGFTPSASGARMTPLSVTVGDSSGSLPTGAVAVIFNTDTSNSIYCNVNAIAATVADQKLPPNSWFAFTIPNSVTTLHCIAVGGTVLANGLGGSGLPTGAGGGGGGGSGSGGPLGVQAISNSQAVNPATSSLWTVAQGSTALSATNGIFANLLQGNAVLSATNPIFVSPATSAGMATSALQTTGNTTLSTIATNTTSIATSALQTTGNTSLASIVTNTALTAAGSSASNASAVQGVTGGLPIPTTTAVNVTPTDCSQTATGSSQTMITASASIHGFTIANIDPTTAGGEPVWISFTGAAVAGAKASYPLAAPTSLSLNGMGSYTTPPGFGANQNVTDIATSGHLISCTRW